MARFEMIDEVLVHEGPVISVFHGRFRSPDGEVMRREVVRHPGAVVVVPVIGAEAVLVRQYRAPIDASILEIPAGKRDVPGEDPAQTARRELAEEVGLAAGNLELLCEFHNTPGFCDEYSYCFLATDCESVDDDRQGAEEVHMTIERVELARVPELIADGTITDGKSIIGLMMARDRLP
jgi:8-oxo-dGTP pyrophosphatase MutT (NUDIX family)